MATLKQKRAVKKLLENGGNVSKAMKEAGYSKATSKTPKKLTEGKGFQELMKEYLPDALLAKVHQEGLAATRLNGVGGMKLNIDKGEIQDMGHSDLETPDYAVRHKYLDTAYKLKGVYAPEKKEITGLLSLANLFDEASK